MWGNLFEKAKLPKEPFGILGNVGVNRVNLGRNLAQFPNLFKTVSLKGVHQPKDWFLRKDI